MNTPFLFKFDDNELIYKFNYIMRKRNLYSVFQQRETPMPITYIEALSVVNTKGKLNYMLKDIAYLMENTIHFKKDFLFMMEVSNSLAELFGHYTR